MKKVILTSDSALLEAQQIPVAELNEKLREKLAAGMVHFTFKKKDGSLRDAYGTVNPDWFRRITGDETIAESTTIPNPALGVYFDLEAAGWRSYTVANLIAVY